MNYQEFQENIDYKFKDIELLNIALTHSSYIKEHHMAKNLCNERLEFIGDCYLDAIIGSYLYENMPSVSEGILSKTRALIVCEDSLYKVGLELNIGQVMSLGRGEELSGGRQRESIIADAMEATIGAIYYDGGYEAAKVFVLHHFHPIIEDAVAGKICADYKSALQEELQGKIKEPTIIYELLDEKGPDHDKTFLVRALCNGREMGRGIGKKKKDAEQNAAKDTLERGTIDVL